MRRVVSVLLASLALGCGGGSSPTGGDAADARVDEAETRSVDAMDAADLGTDVDLQLDADAGAAGSGGTGGTAGAGDAGGAGGHDAADAPGETPPAPADGPGVETASDVAADAPGADRADALVVVDAPAIEVPPAKPPVDLNCTTDTIPPLQPEVFLSLGTAAGGAVPLCSGWVLVSTQAPPALMYRNVLDGRSGGSIPLPGPPGRLVLDVERDTAHVALPSRSSLASVDLQTGAISEVVVAARTASVALGNNGLVFLTEQPFSGESGIAVVDTLHAAVLLEDKLFSTTGLGFDRTGNQLVSVLSGLNRYTFDTGTKMLTRVESPFGTCGAANGVVLSGDGKHVLSGCAPNTNSQAGGFYDLSLSALTTVLGQFVGVTGVAAFSPDSTKLASVGSILPAPLTLKIADVATHTISSATTPGFGCLSPRVDGIAWSRGAKMIHLLMTCDSGTTQTSALYAVQAK